MSDTNYWKHVSTGSVSRRQLIRGASLAGAGLAGAALIGCGDEKTETKPAASTPGGAAAANAPAGPQAKAGGRLVRAQEGDVPSFDQHGESTTLSNLPTSPGYNTIVKWAPDDVLEKPGGLKPSLASSWEITPDGQTYTFKFVQNAKFHDGTPFTAADVKASIERQISPPAGLTPPRQDQLRGAIKAMETPDNFTLKMTMNRPVSPLSMLPILGQGWMVIYSKKDIDGKFDFKKQINGTGPYRDMQYARGNKVSWERNKDYFVKDRPYLDGLDIFIVPDASTRNANLQSGQLQAGAVAAKDWEVMKKALGEKVSYYQNPSLGFYTINFNTSKAPWKDARVRQAVNLALNKEDAMKVLVQGDATIGGYLLPGGEWAIAAEDLRKVPGYGAQGADSIAEAKKLMTAAGVADNLSVTLLTRNLQSYQDMSLFVGDQLNKAFGWKGKSDIVETVIAYDRMTKRDFDLTPWVHGISIDDPDAIWQEFYLDKSPRNYSELSTPAIKAAFDKQTVELDPTKRKALVQELERLSLPELGKAMLFWSKSRYVASKTLQNWQPHVSTYNNMQYQDAWLNA